MVDTAFPALVYAQRAHRQFTDEDVPHDILKEVLELAIRAPSAENKQPWVFVVVREPGVRNELSDLARRVWLGGGRAFAEPKLDPWILEDTDRATASGFGGAPVLIVVGADASSLLPQFIASSIFPAVQNLLLATAAYGFGSTMTTFTTLLADEVRAAVGFPPHIEPMAIVPIGRPARALGPSRRAPLSTKTHLNRYGEPWLPSSVPATADVQQ